MAKTAASASAAALTFAKGQRVRWTRRNGQADTGRVRETVPGARGPFVLIDNEAGGETRVRPSQLVKI